jgi:hypothetical protein
MVYYVDIDETICYYEGERKYSHAFPNLKRINKINNLYEEGHIIVYWTARGSQTGIDWTELTTRQLNEWGVFYHKLEMNKPHYDFFICDKAINTEDFFNE